ncbi:hypothetical protein JOC33_003493 [Thalassobacillus pellis]|nr:hypothetical protein [Thalassobacillus pellis]
MLRFQWQGYPLSHKCFPLTGTTLLP